MRRASLLHLLIIIVLHESVLCGQNILSNVFDENQPNEFDYQKSDDTEFLLNTDKLLQRNKRYLLWTNGGISKVSLFHFFFSSE